LDGTCDASDARATVLGPGEERARRAQAPSFRQRVFASLAEEAPEPHPSLAAVGRGRIGEPEAAREPAEERREELRPPAPQALPRPPDLTRVDRKPEPRADRGPRQPLEEVQPERFEDHASRIPVARMKEVRQHAHRVGSHVL
jgi:hypothetical protein